MKMPKIFDWIVDSPEELVKIRKLEETLEETEIDLEPIQLRFFREVAKGKDPSYYELLLREGAEEFIRSALKAGFSSDSRCERVDSSSAGVVLSIPEVLESWIEDREGTKELLNMFSVIRDFGPLLEYLDVEVEVNGVKIPASRFLVTLYEAYKVETAKDRFDLFASLNIPLDYEVLEEEEEEDVDLFELFNSLMKIVDHDALEKDKKENKDKEEDVFELYTSLLKIPLDQSEKDKKKNKEEEEEEDLGMGM